MANTVIPSELLADSSVATAKIADDAVTGMTQEEINDMVQRNVDHLEIILAYTDPDVAGDSSDKSSYTTAIATGKAYISNNS